MPLMISFSGNLLNFWTLLKPEDLIGHIDVSVLEQKSLHGNATLPLSELEWSFEGGAKNCPAHW